MPTCITLNSNVDFTVTSLSAPQDGYSIAIAMATPSPTVTPVPTPTPTIGYDIFAWGQNTGNFGNDTALNASSPILVTSLGYNDLYNNYGSSWFQKTDGTMWIWGRNNFGQLGLGTAVGVSSPVQLGTGTNEWTTFTIGNQIAAGTKSDGTLWTWGNNLRGALGINTASNASSPTQVGTDTNWSSAFVGIGNTNMFAIKKDGSLWVTGKTDHILGNLFGGVDVSSPVQVGTDTNWSWVYVTQYGNLLQRNDGTYYGLGQQPTGQFAQGTTIPYSSPVQIGAGYAWDSMTASNQHIAAIRSCDKSLWVCGGNAGGALGQDDNIGRSSLIQVGTDTTWTKAIACFQGINGFTIGLKADNTIWAFGGNGYGYLGQSNTTRYSSPVQVGTGNWLDISAGVATVFALKSQSLVPLPTIGATLTPCPTVAPANPTATPNPTASETPLPTASPTATPEATPNPTASATGTPEPTASATPVPTPSPTSVALCINVDGSTNNFTTTQLAGPDNGFSFFNNAIANPTPTVTPIPPTPSPTPAGGLSPGPNCANAGVWPAYGSANTYNITIADNTTEMWFQINPANGTSLYAANNTSGTRIWLTVDNGYPPSTCSSFLGPTPSTYVSLALGVGVTSNGNGIFSIRGNNGTFPYTVDIWIDF